MNFLCETKRNDLIAWLESFCINPENGEKLFLSVFLVHVLFMCLQTTMFKFPNIIFAIEKYLALLLIVLKIIVFDKYNNKLLLFSAVLLIDAFLVMGVSKYQDVLIFSIVLLGSKDVDFVKLLKIYTIGVVVVLLTAFVASRLDIIEDLVYIRDYVVERNSFGTIYPTDFAAHIFFLLCAYYYVIRDSIQTRHLLAGIFISTLVYAFCDTRLDSITMLFLVIGVSLIRFSNPLILDKDGPLSRFKGVVISTIPYIPIMGFLFMHFMSYFFQPSMTFFRLFDTLLSGRLKLGNKALEDYGLTLFGQTVPMNGYGGSLISLGGNYFFIDCSYLLVYLRYGVLFLLLVFLIHYWCCKKYKGDMSYLVILTVVVINCVVAHHMIELAYNPFYLALLAKKSG